MNISELARILKINPNELRENLPKLGFDIGYKAIKIDNFTANKIIRNWGVLSRRLPKKDIASGEAGVIVKPAVEKASVPAFIAVKDFAALLKISLNKLLGELMKNNIFTSLNEKIDFETAMIIGADLGVEITLLEEDKAGAETDQSAQDKIKISLSQSDKPDNICVRPPVVVIMGHVDHGKTKLLDAIRHTDVVATEAGGITQHIGAYQISHNKKEITFIDTPGHEAFTAMRNRGAKVADIAILVVAADDGVKPQTVEAYRIIEAAKLPFIVAINKIDKSDANVDRVKQELSSQLNVLVEDWGGKVISVPLSAKDGTGVTDLLDMILLVADMTTDTLKADPSAKAVGTIIESKLDKGEGPIATVLVQNGTLRVGDPISFNGIACGKVRSLKDHLGNIVSDAIPGTPVKLNGLKFVPEVGDVLEVGEGEKVKQQKNRSTIGQNAAVDTNDKTEVTGPVINLIVKSDTIGLGEAIENSISKMDAQGVLVKIVAKGLGNITEGDVLRAETNSAILVGFNVKLAPHAEELARDKGVSVTLYRIIYDLVNDIKARIQELVKPEIERVNLGRLKVAAIFRTENKVQILGGRVLDGVLKAGTKLEVKRGEEIITSGIMGGLQSGKQEAQQVEANQECGLRFEGAPLVEVGDIIECYEEKQIIKKVG
ncbi:MAG: translation initiation factor IF-2 [Candidatus Falkowbacteria bacterium]|nr:translation initiation factor IF-2 [Candidatus Falkowbacteria bacterium]